MNSVRDRLLDSKKVRTVIRYEIYKENRTKFKMVSF